ncbi:hypothetical protein JCM39068_16830 [Desulfocastanea catecholica]
MLDELEWARENAKISDDARDRAVEELIGIVVDVDGILQSQSAVDVDYFLKISGRSFTEDEIRQLQSGFLTAYRWQYIFSGVEHPRY